MERASLEVELACIPKKIVDCFGKILLEIACRVSVWICHFTNAIGEPRERGVDSRGRLP